VDPKSRGTHAVRTGNEIVKPIVGFHNLTNRSKLRAKASWLFHLVFSALYFGFLAFPSDLIKEIDDETLSFIYFYDRLF
jgi:hypothetical protein